MMFFNRNQLTVRCSYRGLAMAVPDHDRLLNACASGERRRLQRLLGRPSPDELPWLVQWRKRAGGSVEPNEIVAALFRDGVTAELAYVYGGALAERLVDDGDLVATGRRIARLERRAKEPEKPASLLLRHYVERQRRDAATIAALQVQLAALQARLTTDATPGADAKFRRLKHEFSRRFHPDSQPLTMAERLRRERVFQEFWPIVEEIERS
jgi:hypothetical protein